jgi:abscission/NoCut checkpoint regulator
LQDEPKNIPDIPVLQPVPVNPTPDSGDADAELRARLDALKDEPVDSTSNDTDLAKRLAALKGVEHKEYDHKSFINAVDRRTDQEKTDDLVKQFLEEVDIDAKKVDPISDIERRLALLRGDPVDEVGAKDKRLAKQLDSEPEEDDETVAKKLMKRYIEEAKIEGPLDPAEKEFLESLPPPTADTEELPWCTICNEDATIRCVGCDGELFCARCFKEIHDDEEYRAHETKAYKKPKENEEMGN